MAVVGYKVRLSDMAEVAQKLEQLEEAMGMDQDDITHHLSFDTVHYNPADISNWLQTMFSNFDPPPPNNNNLPSSSNYDLKAILGNAIYAADIATEPPPSKRTTSTTTTAESTRSVVEVDSQDNGIRLIHTLTPYPLLRDVPLPTR